MSTLAGIVSMDTTALLQLDPALHWQAHSAPAR